VALAVKIDSSIDDKNLIQNDNSIERVLSYWELAASQKRSTTGEG
jgi:hypothetical protein